MTVKGKKRKTTVGNITNNLVKVAQSTVHRRLQKYKGYTRRCEPLMSNKKRKAKLVSAKKYKRGSKVLSSQFKFYGLMRKRLTFIKVMERLTCGERGSAHDEHDEKPPKQTTTERGCGEEKHHEGRMQKFGDVSWSQAYCKRRIYNYQSGPILLLTLVFRYKRCYLLSILTNFDVNTWK